MLLFGIKGFYWKLILTLLSDFCNLDWASHKHRNIMACQTKDWCQIQKRYIVRFCFLSVYQSFCYSYSYHFSSRTKYIYMFLVLYIKQIRNIVAILVTNIYSRTFIHFTGAEPKLSTQIFLQSKPLGLLKKAIFDSYCLQRKCLQAINVSKGCLWSISGHLLQNWAKDTIYSPFTFREINLKSLNVIS